MLLGPDEGTRTPNPQFRRLMLYPLSYVRAPEYDTQRPNICKFTKNLVK